MNILQDSQETSRAPLTFSSLLQRPYIQISGILVLAASLKLGLVVSGVIPFNADEAVVALMARHILAGERPVFFYGQAYMGSLDAYLVAFFFQILGQQVWVIRFVQGLLYLGTLISTYGIGVLAFQSKRAGLFAMGLMAVPTVNLTLYTTVSLGGYGEALLLGNLLLLVCLRLQARTSKGPLSWSHLGCAMENDRNEGAFKSECTLRVQFAKRTVDRKRMIGEGCLLCGGWGLLAGVGIWANGLTLVYILPTGVVLLVGLTRLVRGGFKRRSILMAGLAGMAFFVGSLPWWWYCLQYGPGTLISELFGSAVAVESGSWLARALVHLASFLLLGMPVIIGLRPPWDVTWLMVPLIPLIILFWGWILVSLIQRLWQKGTVQTANWLLAGVMGVVLAGFIGTAFGVDPSGRYFLPFAVPLSLMAAYSILALKPRIWRWGLALLVTGFQLGGTVQSAVWGSTGLTTQFDPSVVVDHRYDQDLVRFLQSEGEKRGYTNYWVAYPLAFLSQEDLIFIPRLPYHSDFRFTQRDDRYLPYDALVNESPRVAYITSRHPELDERLRAGFDSQHVQWDEKRIGDYTVFYHLSKVVAPDDLNLGLVFR